VLKTLRVLRPNRIITVFGCGGDRDRVKRPLMARAAEQGSDICILTSDNPRMEDPKQIIADARKGFTGKNFGEIEDRAQAIRTAISNASPGDIVLIAGKGHEDYQDIKGVKHPFDDRKVAKVAINSRREMAGLRRLENQREQTERESRHRADDDYDPNVRRWNQ
jgi:UDP-N-acetylmuramoyl-L-alanyl-D-glutamate--2,6-diaminopimelate ligase